MNINDLTYKINGAAYEVHSVLGPGFFEKVYENALLHELERQGLQAQSQVPLKVAYKGIVAGDFIGDILVEKRVLIELKTVTGIINIHESQVINYLKAADLDIGIIFNFKSEKLQIKRVLNKLKTFM